MFADLLFNSQQLQEKTSRLTKTSSGPIVASFCFLEEAFGKFLREEFDVVCDCFLLSIVLQKLFRVVNELLSRVEQNRLHLKTPKKEADVL